ncbi:hypothetical protein J4Q44_G00309810 [Coregonus suidteri]|uniref:protein-tyrosine-phosphatase n=1 Tax=Coregonus suidteri TaxID=861788 RepID=A0AAN8L375_9TELE
MHSFKTQHILHVYIPYLSMYLDYKISNMFIIFYLWHFPTCALMIHKIIPIPQHRCRVPPRAAGGVKTRAVWSWTAAHSSPSTPLTSPGPPTSAARRGLGVGHIVPNEDTRNRLLSGEYRSVVFLDDRSLDFGQVKNDGTLMLAVTALCRDPCGASVFFLKGGFDTFSSEYPEMCTKPSAPPGLSLPLSARPDSADPSCSPCSTALYDQGGPVEILPFLYLGSAYHASRKDMLDMLGITALINVSANCPNHFEESFQYKSIPVEDNHKADISSWFNEAIEFIVTCIKSQVLATSSCSSEAGSPALGKSSTVFNFPVSIPIHGSAGHGQLSFLHSPITTSPSC